MQMIPNFNMLISMNQLSKKIFSSKFCHQVDYGLKWPILAILGPMNIIRAVSSGTVYTLKYKHFEILFGSVYRLKASNPKTDMDKSYPICTRPQIKNISKYFQIFPFLVLNTSCHNSFKNQYIWELSIDLSPGTYRNSF